MKKFYYSDNDTISVYQFMSMCGLDVIYQKDKPLSHQGMMEKLVGKQGKVTIPTKPNLAHCYSLDNIKRGRIVLVKDDYNKVLVYNRPIGNVIVNTQKTEEEMEKIREKLLEEYLKERETKHQETTPGYQKYLKRKNISK